MTDLLPADAHSGVTLQGLFAMIWRKGQRIIVLGLILIALYIGFCLLRENFRGMGNVVLMLKQSVMVGIAAVAMTAVIVMGGIDLSVGSIVALGSVVAALVLEDVAEPTTTMAVVAALAAVGIGMLCGAANGALIVTTGMTPFIVTLGTMQIVRGLAKWAADEQTVVPNAAGWYETLLTFDKPGFHASLVPIGFWLLLLTAVGFVVFLQLMRWGRYTYAIGSSEETARLCGVPVGWVKMLVYTLMGGAAGLSGVVLMSRIGGMGSPTEEIGMELKVIAAVVIGGGSLSGGEGSVLGTLIGVLIMTVIAKGCTQLGLDSYVQEIVVGAIIIGAVAIDQIRHRRAV